MRFIEGRHPYLEAGEDSQIHAPPVSGKGKTAVVATIADLRPVRRHHPVGGGGGVKGVAAVPSICGTVMDGRMLARRQTSFVKKKSRKDRQLGRLLRAETLEQKLLL